MRQDTPQYDRGQDACIYQLPMRQDTQRNDEVNRGWFFQLPMRQDTTAKFKNSLNLQ